MGNLVRLHFEQEIDWLEARKNGIGASEAAAVFGVSPWLSSLSLWEQKTGQSKPKDKSDNADIQRGKQFEPILRDIFALQHPEFEVKHCPYDMLSQSDRPWLFSTLDGEIRNRENKHLGILEIKTAAPRSRSDWSKWDQQIPPQYFFQIIHQLASTGWDFVYLMAALFFEEDISIRTYFFPREEYQENIDALIKRETEFWEENVQKKKVPNVILNF